MRLSIQTLFYVIAGLVCFGASSAKAELILNGSFETFTSSDFGAAGYGITQTAIPNWTGTTPDSFVRIGLNGTGGSNENATNFANNGVIPDGTHVAFLQAASTLVPTTLFQTLPNLTLGPAEYLLTFSYNARAAQGGASDLTVTLGSGGTPHTFSIGTVNPVEANGVHTLSYYSASFTFTASALAGDDASPTLTFKSLGFDRTVLLDKVSLVRIPEPSSILLLGIGLTGMMGFARRRHSLT